jgi:hypothetical protein
MQRTLLAALASVFATACFAGCLAESARGPSARHPVAVDDPDRITCQDEKATGSNISRPVCRSQDEVFRDDAAANEWMNNWPPNPTRGESVHVGTDPFGRIYPE